MKAVDREIAVFDSGVGGLTVFRALRRALPAERLVYFGDTARLPYGSKSPEAVARFSVEIGRFLCRRRIKLYVVACNSASALALGALRRALPVPVIGVIEPAVRAAADGRKDRRPVGVIGTEATVRSRAYEKALSRALPGARVVAQACPLLVPLVEEGWWEREVTEEVAREYLKPIRRAGAGSLILGCTHYPLIKPLLARVAGKGVRLIDSGEEAAREAAAILEARGLKRRARRGSETFFASDGAERFRRLAGRILGGAPGVRVVRLPL